MKRPGLARAWPARIALTVGVVVAPLGLAPVAQSGMVLPVVAAPAHADVSGWGGWNARGPTYPKVAVESNVPIVMSDHLVLLADIHHPADAKGVIVPGRFPVLVTQTPYNKQLPATNFATDYMVTRGYVQVIVDVRGTGSSPGQWQSFGEREQQDGYDIVKWAASLARPWSNGNIGLHGESYGAINQLLTAERQPPGLKAIFPIVPGGDTYRDIGWNGGEVDASFIPFWLGLVTGQGLVPAPPATPASAMTAALTELGRAPAASNFQVNTILDGILGGDTAYDGPFYHLRSPLTNIARVNVPAFVVGGWFDLFQRSEPAIYQAIRGNGVPARLLMGPWYHVSPGLSPGLPSQGVPSLDALELRWFDHYVRGVSDPGLDATPQVTYNQLNNGWTTAASWPPPGTQFQQLYPVGGSSVGVPGSMATSPPPGPAPADTLPWDFAAGACSRSTTQWSAGLTTLVGSLPCDNNNQFTDALGLSYDLPVAAPVHIAGPMSAHLWIESNRDTNVTVRVEDVAPDGTSYQVSSGYITIGERALDLSKSVVVASSTGPLVVRPYQYYTKATKVPVSAGQVIDMWVEIYNSSATIASGHKIRMSVQTADTPHLLPNVVQAPETVGAVLHLYHDSAHPSSLVLPVMEPVVDAGSGVSGAGTGAAAGSVAALAGTLPTTSALPDSRQLALKILLMGLALSVLAGGVVTRTRAKKP